VVIVGVDPQKEEAVQWCKTHLYNLDIADNDYFCHQGGFWRCRPYKSGKEDIWVNLFIVGDVVLPYGTLWDKVSHL
jgi:hypothetical protein